MKNWRVLVAIVAIGAVAAAGWAYAQGRGGSGELTGQDIAEIERLYYRYAQGLDFQDEDLYVSAYAEDAVFTTGAGEVWEGHEGLRARFRQRPGAEGTGITHVTVNIIVKGTPEGAKGRGYWIVVDTLQSPPAIVGHGHYFDTFTRTSDGWRIQTRGSMRGWSEERWATESRSTAW